MIHKGEEIKNAKGEVVFIATEDVYVGKEMNGREFVRPDGSYPEIGTLMDKDLVEELDKRGLRPFHG